MALVGPDTLPDIRRVDARPERHIPSDGLGINHVLHTLDEGWPWRGQVLAWHLVRLLSLPLSWLTLLAIYTLARRLLPGQQLAAVAAVAFVAVLPRFVSSSAVINDDNLVFAQIGLLLLVQVIILQQGRRATPWLFALAGGLFGLALLTKYFSLILVPELLFTLIAYYFMTRTRPPALAAGNPFIPYLAFFLALLLVAGPWFAFIFLRFNRVAELGLIPGLAASLGEPQITEGLAGLLSGQSVRPVAATYGLLDWFSLLYRSFWFEYGWMQLFAPTWVYTLFSLFLLAALAGLLLRMANLPGRWRLGSAATTSAKRAPGSQGALRPRFSPVHLLLLLHLALFVLVVLARYVLSATIDTGQGRHLYPALPVLALLLALGLVHLYRLACRSHLALPAALLVPGLFYLLPATFCLLPAFFVLPYYRYLPLTGAPAVLLPIQYRQAQPVIPGLFLAGFDVTGSATAGTALPVTLYWRAESEASQDYLVSLCLQPTDGPPAAAWQPVAGLETFLYSPCADAGAPLARLSHFIAGPTLPRGVYQADDGELAAARLALSGRSRDLAPLASGLAFTPYLSPLALYLPPDISVNLPAAPASEPYPLAPGSRLPVTIRWQARHWMAEPLVLSLKLLDKDFLVGSERIATLGDRYPNVLWAPGEIVEETYPLRLETGTPPGLYRLEISLLRQDERLAGGYEYIPLARDGLALPDHNLYPVTFRLLDPGHDTVPPQPLLAGVGQAIQLAGYGLDRSAAAGSQHTFELVLYWRSSKRPGADYTVFTQLVGPDGQVWAQWDNPPQAGRYPTSAWTAQDRVVDRYTLALRTGAPPGRYRLLAGMYDPATGQRLPVTIDGRPQPDNAIQVAVFDIETES